eukprot:CAMPEP_0185693088 /NCGR_PEP_ID=MMETSP1164-20130828/2986_1 /TAXON_ID=1104430 /ORGANISM="Chrysoreinhardia sp, Strain CCMP2950" /LENGTH=476 /DNA_ID=CAMNT_0028359853 /DNA_START=21 /DNA_END=1452 /DNA_ORIENTATION=-
MQRVNSMMLAAQVDDAELMYWSYGAGPSGGSTYAEVAGVQIRRATPCAAQNCIASFRLILARAWDNGAGAVPTYEPRWYDGVIERRVPIAQSCPPQSSWRLRVSRYDDRYRDAPPRDLTLVGARLGARALELRLGGYRWGSSSSSSGSAAPRSLALRRADDIADFTRRLSPFTVQSVSWLVRGVAKPKSGEEDLCGVVAEEDDEAAEDETTEAPPRIEAAAAAAASSDADWTLARRAGSLDDDDDDDDDDTEGSSESEEKFHDAGVVHHAGQCSAWGPGSPLSAYYLHSPAWDLVLDRRPPPSKSPSGEKLARTRGCISVVSLLPSSASGGGQPERNVLAVARACTVATPSTTTPTSRPEPVLGRRRGANDEGGRCGVLAMRVDAVLAADARIPEASPGRVGRVAMVRVGPDDARAEAREDTVEAFGVARPDGRAERVAVVVRERDGLVLGREGHDRHDGPEDLVLEAGHARRDVA